MGPYGRMINALLLANFSFLRPQARSLFLHFSNWNLSLRQRYGKPNFCSLSALGKFVYTVCETFRNQRTNMPIIVFELSCKQCINVILDKSYDNYDILWFLRGHLATSVFGGQLMNSSTFVWVLSLLCTWSKAPIFICCYFVHLREAQNASSTRTSW